MKVAYLNSIANHGGTLIKKVGLLNSTGAAITGGSPAYADKDVTFAPAQNGKLAFAEDVVFNIPAGTTVTGWVLKAEDGSLLGQGTLTAEVFSSQGEYVLKATESGITHLTPL